ncbi:MAG: hypothetical protein K9G61_03445, partial [Bacteroidales bacterium]|nr:hypothetical protein [Bacteroidales bacterium]
ELRIAPNHAFAGLNYISTLRLAQCNANSNPRIRGTNPRIRGTGPRELYFFTEEAVWLPGFKPLFLENKLPTGSPKI